ncbi:MAG: hypothetical protein ACRCXT_14505 [Paraclostridium sp.]
MNINNLTHKQLINKIVNQANSLNKKIKAFKNANIMEHEELVHNLLSDEQVQYNKSGSITKSTKFYDAQSDIWLKKTLSTLVKLNNNEIYGTINKYNKYATQSWNTLNDTVTSILKEYGYDDTFIAELTSSKDFYNKLYLAFNDASLSYGSKQIVNKVALDYSENGLSDEERDRITSDIEYSKNKMDELTTQISQYEDYLKSKGIDRSGKNKR